MGTFVLRRLLALVPLMLLISFAVFALVLLLPGDPARQIAGGLGAPEERVEEIREELGLDDPLVVQYGRWLGSAARFDLGESLFSRRPVAEEIARLFPVTLSLALGALVVSLLLGLPAGVLAGTRPGTWADRAVAFGSSAAIAMPDFWLATILVALFAVQADVLPAIGYVAFTESPVEWARHLLLPWIALGVSAAAGLARQVRGALVDVLEQDYVRTARAKGLPPRLVVGKHALKNAATPALTVAGLQFAYLLGGTVIVEYVFGIPGLGQYLLNAIVKHDLPVIQGVTLMVATIFVVVNLAVDVAYGMVNPKVRLG